MCALCAWHPAQVDTFKGWTTLLPQDAVFAGCIAGSRWLVALAQAALAAARLLCSLPLPQPARPQSKTSCLLFLTESTVLFKYTRDHTYITW